MEEKMVDKKADLGKHDFQAMAKRLSSVPIPVQKEPSDIPDETVERVAGMMVRCGYEMGADALSALNDYMRGYNLWICGAVGVGKTFFFECLNSVRRSMGIQPIVKLSMLETQGWTMEDAAKWSERTYEMDVLIDDVGAEPMLNHYGEKVEVFPYLLEMRMARRSCRTHMTSNLGASDILKRYERRVADRFAQMFKMVEIKSKKSRRRVEPWIRQTSDGGFLI